jgi:hypothetical protein
MAGADFQEYRFLFPFTLDSNQEIFLNIAGHDFMWERGLF